MWQAHCFRLDVDSGSPLRLEYCIEPAEFKAEWLVTRLLHDQLRDRGQNWAPIWERGGGGGGGFDSIAPVKWGGGFMKPPQSVKVIRNRPNLMRKCPAVCLSEHIVKVAPLILMEFIYLSPKYLSIATDGVSQRMNHVLWCILFIWAPRIRW